MTNLLIAIAPVAWSKLSYFYSVPLRSNVNSISTFEQIVTAAAHGLVDWNVIVAARKAGADIKICVERMGHM